MSFSVSFHLALPSDAPSTAPVSSELDADYNTLVIEACSALSDAGGGSFHIGGFGSDAWPLDVAYDLSAFMEQLPSLLAGVRERREVEVDLYSQGIERTLTFRPVENRVVIQCESRTNWVPSPEFESLAQGELVAMLSKMAEEFAGGLKAISSELSGVAPFACWLGGEV
ncbi:hypothetical protein [Streptomyces antarcticus]|uniref:hypothetical protein n=1 Tax=Streptomyces antarcticus TaxID=2996458 RepID=UPI0022704AE0|nr:MULTISPECIES: hypothetical protein [unclassified Streptomyces]MCY0947663.1 hypothetical protein [Streptomyces sp. H34-AA3]MCZ4088139.1 hypothetical protein [Streptomyces sp. H34-S5]